MLSLKVQAWHARGSRAYSDKTLIEPTEDRTHLTKLNAHHSHQHSVFSQKAQMTINVFIADCGDENAQGIWQGAEGETFTMIFPHQTLPKSLSFPGGRARQIRGGLTTRKHF
jgi:hypothetical protein